MRSAMLQHAQTATEPWNCMPHRHLPGQQAWRVPIWRAPWKFGRQDAMQAGKDCPSKFATLAPHATMASLTRRVFSGYPHLGAGEPFPTAAMHRLTLPYRNSIAACLHCRLNPPQEAVRQRAFPPASPVHGHSAGSCCWNTTGGTGSEPTNRQDALAFPTGASATFAEQNIHV